LSPAAALCTLGKDEPPAIVALLEKTAASLADVSPEQLPALADELHHALLQLCATEALAGRAAELVLEHRPALSTEEQRIAFILKWSLVGETFEREQPFTEEAPARVAWLALIASAETDEAHVVRTTGDRATRYRCTWDRRGGFRDVTDLHAREIRALVEKLQAEAPEGYEIRVAEGRAGAWLEMTRDGGRHVIALDVSDQARVRAHWQGFLPTPRER
jgi:hypothetical protein